MSNSLVKNKQGLVRVFYGEGRGKTSAALGEVFKANSLGLKVCVVFFLKGKRQDAEYKTLKTLSVKYATFGRSGFLSQADAKILDTELCRQALDFAETQIDSGKWDMVVLDEINNAQYYDLIKVDDILKLLAMRPVHTSLVLTGKFVDKHVSDLADQVCDFQKIKHPYDKGILARRGFDF